MEATHENREAREEEDEHHEDAEDLGVGGRVEDRCADQGEDVEEDEPPVRGAR